MSAHYQLLHVIKQYEQILVERKVSRVAGNTACVEEVPQLPARTVAVQCSLDSGRFGLKFPPGKQRAVSLYRI